MGVVRLLGKQQPDKMRTYKLRPITETAEQAREAKGQKGKIAKQILLGIDAHLNGYQVCRKIDAGGLQPVQIFSLEKLLLFSYKQLELAEKVYAVYEAGPLARPTRSEHPGGPSALCAHRP